MKAAFAGEYRIVERLIDCGADPRATCNKGRTALHYAVSGLNPESKSKKVAMILLEAGADASAVDGSGNAPKNLARQRYSDEYVALLS
jgi:ankyrin repeat protein